MNIFEEIVALQKDGVPIVLATVIGATGATPRGIGAKMLIKSDGAIVGTIGGGAIERLVQDEAKSLFEDGGSKTIERNLASLGMQCGGSTVIFLECLQRHPHLYIFGAGNIGTSLAEMAKHIEFHVTVIDDRVEFANKSRLPFADEVINGNFPSTIEQLHFDDETYIAIMTYGHNYDYEIVERIITRPHKYIGLVASRKKAQTFVSRLTKLGIEPGLIDAIHSPVGLDIGAETPQEIAVSILAELVRVKNQTS